MKRKVFLLVALYFSLFMFHVSHTNAQSWLWAGYGIGVGPVTSIASDEIGDCYLQGYLTNNDTVHFGSYTLVNSTVNHPHLEIFLAKYSHNGNLLWAKQTIDSGKGISFSGGIVSADRWGNAYIASDFSDSLIIDTYSCVVSKGDDSYIVKYDPSGNVKWVEHSNCSKSDTGEFTANEYISCDINGNLYLSGAFADTVYFGGYRLIGTSPQYDGNSYMVKYDSNGNVKWAKQSTYTGNNSSDVSYCNTNDRFGNSFLSGNFVDTVSFGAHQLIAGSNPVFYLIKYDSNGNVKWARQSTEISGGSSSGISLAANQAGYIYAAGQFTGGAVFSQDTLIAASTSSFFLVKYDLNGNLLWAKQSEVLDNNIWNLGNISIDNSKHIYLVAGGGYQTCKIAFGGDTLSMYDTASIDEASVIFKLDSNGNALCSAIISGGGAQQPNAIASDTSGNYIYFGAATLTPIIFGKDTVNPFSTPPNIILGGNEFPFAARWEACDTNALTTSVQEQKIIGQVTLYPNPNNGIFTVALQNVNEPAQMEVYNVLGEEIYLAKLNPGNTQVNLGSQAEGIYFYRVVNETGGLIGSGKLIIKK